MRKYRRRLSLVLAVIGGISLVISVVMAAAGMMRMAHEQDRFYRVALVYLASSAAVLLVRYLFFVLPQKVRYHQSDTAQRRREYYRQVQRPVTSSSKKEGSILLFAIVLLGIISTVAVHALVSSRSLHKEAALMARQSLLKSAAIDTAHAALQLLADDDATVDHLEEPWAKTSEEIDPAGIARRLRVRDLQSAFDLNNVSVAATAGAWPPTEILAGIMTSCGIFTPGNQVEALRDWVDNDNAGMYEKEHYLKKTAPYVPADRILYSMGDLADVEGWNAGMFEQKPGGGRAMFSGDLVESVTVIPAARSRVIPINLNTASPDALMGLFGIGGESMVERILIRRKAGPIANLDFLERQIDPAIYERIGAYIDFRSSWFLVEASAHGEGGVERVDLVAYRGENGRVDVVRAMF